MEVGSVVRAVFEFLPSVSEELPLFTGDVIEVLSIVDEFWLLGNKDGVTGQFPSTFVEEVTIPSSRPGDRLHVCINDFSSAETGRLPLRRGNLPVMQEVYSDPLSFGFQSVLALFQRQTQWGAEPQQVWNVASMTLDCRADIPLILQEQRIYSRYDSRWNTGDVVVVEVGGSKDLGETWRRGCNALGARGLFPTSCVKELNLSGRSRQLSERSAQAQALDIPPYALGQARALMSLHAQLNEELDFREGDLIIITGLPESGWFQGELEGRRGIFPEGFVELLGPLRSPQEPADCQYLSHGSEQFSYEDSFDAGEGTEEEGAVDGDVFVGEEEEQKVAEEQEPEEEEEGGVFAVALYDFRAIEAGELDFDTGDRIRVLSTLADGWLEGALRGRYGIFPHRFVKIQDDQQKPVDAVKLENGQENISGPPSPSGTEIDPEWRTYEDHTVWDLDYFERTEEQTGKCENAGPKSGSRAQQRGEADPQPRRPAALPQQRPERPRSTPPARPKLPSRLSLPSQRNDPSSDTHQSKNANGSSRSLQSRLSHTLPNTQSGWSRDSRYRQSPPEGASTNSKSLTLIQGLVSLAQSPKKMTRHASVNDADLMTGDPQARRSQKSFIGSSGLRTFATSASDLETKLSQQLFEFEKSLTTSWSDTSVSSAAPRGVTSVDDPSQLSQISRHFSILDYSDESDIIRGSHQSSSLERRQTLRPPPPRPSVLRRLAIANYKPARPAPRRPPQRQNTAPPNSNSIANTFYSPDEVASNILEQGPGGGQEFGDLAAAQEQEIQRNLEAEKELEREMELEDERQKEEEKRYQLLLRLQEVEQDMEAYAHTAEELRTMLDEEEDETARMQALENLEFCNYTLETLALEQQQLQGRSLVGARA